MEETETKGDSPDFKGSLDVAAWYNTTKDGKSYLSVKFSNRVNLFRFHYKPAVNSATAVY